MGEALDCFICFPRDPRRDKLEAFEKTFFGPGIRISAWGATNNRVCGFH
jgi:hypothetical protein